MMMCLGVFLLGSNFFGTFWASWTSCKSISLARLGKFSFIICSNKFSTSYSCSSPSGTPIILMLEHVKLSWRFLKPLLIFLNSCFFILFQLDVYLFLLFQSLIWVLFSFPSLLVPCIFCFISLWVACICSFILQPHSLSSASILMTSVSYPVSHRLAVSSLLGSFSGVLICSFIWAIFLCLGGPVML